MKNKFFVVSCFSDKDDVNWLNSYAPSYHLYSKGNTRLDNLLSENITEISNVGYNIYSYFKYIVDNYDCLPDVMVFCKSNVFPRHISKSTFDELILRDSFTPLDEPDRWNLDYPICDLSCENGYLEINDSWYLTADNPTKYFHSFNDFYFSVFNSKVVPRYLRFSPGGNYIVPKANVLLRTKGFYKNLMEMVSHHKFSGESHIIERSLCIIWNSTVKENESFRLQSKPNYSRGVINVPKKALRKLIFKSISALAKLERKI